MLVQSVIILYYDSLSDTIAEYDLDKIMEAIDTISLKAKNTENNALCVEQIILMFTDE